MHERKPEPDYAMTRLTRKEKSLTAAMVMLIIVLIAMELAKWKKPVRIPAIWNDEAQQSDEVHC